MNKIINNLIVFLFILVITLPLFSVVLGSFKSSEVFYHAGPLELNYDASLDNYINVLSNPDFYKSILTTILIIVLTIILTTIVSSMVSYVLVLFDFKFKKIVISVLTLMSLLPSITLQIFVFQIMNGLNLYDNIISVILIYSVSDIVIIYLFSQYISQIDKNVFKSAYLQGASDFDIYTKIILPYLKEAIMLVAIYKTIIIYNDLYIQSMYLPTKQTISTFLYQSVGMYSIDWPTIYATIVVSLIPILVILLLINIYLKEFND